MHALKTLLLGGLLAVSASTAVAQTAPAKVSEASPPASAKAADAAWPKAAPLERLDGLRGGADTVTTQATLNGTVADNSARNVVTGNNVIDNGSFANMNGLPMVIQNTGANVLIQNATVINLQLR
jgi:hypothetical protein